MTVSIGLGRVTQNGPMDNSDYDTTRYDRPAQRALEGRQKLAESAARNRPNDKQKKIKVKDRSVRNNGNCRRVCKCQHLCLQRLRAGVSVLKLKLKSKPVQRKEEGLYNKCIHRCKNVQIKF